MPDFDDSDFEDEEKRARDSIRVSPNKRDSLFIEHES
jgi:hypothetical protein